MSANFNSNKSDFIRFVMSTIDFDSSDNQKSREYMSSQGLNVDAIVSEGLKKIKKMQMKINAEKTKMEMISNEEIKKKAEEWVNNLLNGMEFSLVELVKKEELSLSFRNMDSLTKDDLKDILVKHFTLKFLDSKKKADADDGI